MDYIQAIIQQRGQAAKERMQAEERRILEDFAATGQATAQGMNSAIKELQAAATMLQQRQQALIIANAATAAAIRKQFTREEVEVIITPAAETGTAYVVTDEELKKQLLESIEKRGY